MSNKATRLNVPCGSYEYLGKKSTNKHAKIAIDYNSDVDLELLQSDLEYLLDKSYYVTVVTGDVNNDNPIDLLCQKLGVRTELLWYRNKLIDSRLKNSVARCWKQGQSKFLRKHY